MKILSKTAAEEGCKVTGLSSDRDEEWAPNIHIITGDL